MDQPPPEDMPQVVLGGLGQKQQEGVHETLHVGRMRKSLIELEVACFWTPATPASQRRQTAYRRLALGSTPQLYPTHSSVPATTLPQALPVARLSCRLRGFSAG
jgi:hypothetical protein